MEDKELNIIDHLDELRRDSLLLLPLLLSFLLSVLCM